MIKRVAILGVGLIGGSLALAFRRGPNRLTIVGYDRTEVLDEAHRLGVIDERAADPGTAVRDADLVILATPIGAILRLLDAVALHLKPGAVVTDVGSVKQPVLAQARDVLPVPSAFIGGHPMTGSEHGGVTHADPFLFENATYVLCPPAGMSEDYATRAFADLIALLQGTGARLLVLDAAVHDRIASTVSHLPQLLAVMLMNLAADRTGEHDAFLKLAAGGFRDMTRIASSSFPMWRDILIANQGNILDALAHFAAALQKTRNRLAVEDLGQLEGAFVQARTVRETIPKDTKGFLRPLADLYVHAEDRPGALLHIVQTLYDAEVNIKDIELLKIREGTGGTFRLGFADEPTVQTAIETLRSAGLKAHRL